MSLKITQIRTSDDDGEGNYTLEMDEYAMRALVGILTKIESTYAGYTPPYTTRYAEASALASLLKAAKNLDIQPFKA